MNLAWPTDERGQDDFGHDTIDSDGRRRRQQHLLNYCGNRGSNWSFYFLRQLGKRRSGVSRFGLSETINCFVEPRLWSKEGVKSKLGVSLVIPSRRRFRRILIYTTVAWATAAPFSLSLFPGGGGAGGRSCRAFSARAFAEQLRMIRSDVMGYTWGVAAYDDI